MRLLLRGGRTQTRTSQREFVKQKNTKIKRQGWGLFNIRSCHNLQFIIIMYLSFTDSLCLCLLIFFTYIKGVPIRAPDLVFELNTLFIWKVIISALSSVICLTFYSIHQGFPTFLWRGRIRDCKKIVAGANRHKMLSRDFLTNSGQCSQFSYFSLHLARFWKLK